MALNNPTEIFYLNFYDYSPPLLNYKLLKAFLSSFPLSIKRISFYSSNLEVKKHFTNIIQSQSQLSSITFWLDDVSLFDSFKYLSNTLTSINFYSCDFSKSMRFDALSCLIQLESLQFKRCSGLNLKVIQPLLNIATPLKIKTFVINDQKITNSSEKFTAIQLLIQKIGSYIENLVLDIYHNELRRKLFDTIIDFCEKIKFLHLSHVDIVNISQLSKMFVKFGNYLKYLTLGIKYYTSNEDDLKISSMVLKELTKSLPLSLQYLDLTLVINPVDLRIAFENCKQVELKKLLIRNRSRNNEGTTLKVIKDFVEENNLEFLSYAIGSTLLNGEEIRHKSLEKLVKETQSFIKMMRYDDLAIKISEIDGNLNY
jgi:hypothetical protein